MTKETKIGLVVGLAFILMFAIILSEKQVPKDLNNFTSQAAELVATIASTQPTEPEEVVNITSTQTAEAAVVPAPAVEMLKVRQLGLYETSSETPALTNIQWIEIEGHHRWLIFNGNPEHDPDCPCK